MQPIESSTHDVILCLWRCPIKLDPLTLLDQLQNICSGANAIWKPTCSIASQAQESDDGWPVRLQLWVFPWFLVDLLVSLLDDRGHYRGGTIAVVVDPWLFWILVAF